MGGAGMTMFDSNKLAALASVKADRYQRNGGGGGGYVVYATARTMFEKRGFKELSPFEQARIEMTHRYREAAAMARAHFSTNCFAAREGYGPDDEIPF